MFKVGDKVRKISGDTFSNGDEIVTVRNIEHVTDSNYAQQNRIWFVETYTWCDENEIELVEKCIELSVVETHKLTNFNKGLVSPIVSEPKIVAGEYGSLYIYYSNEGELRIEVTKSVHTAEELRHASVVLREIAEFMENEAGNN